MEGYGIRCHNEEEYHSIIDAACDMGYYWASQKGLGEESNRAYTPYDVINNSYNVFIYIMSNIMYGLDISRISPGYEEISVEDFLEMCSEDVEAEEISITELMGM